LNIMALKNNVRLPYLIGDGLKVLFVFPAIILITAILKNVTYFSAIDAITKLHSLVTLCFQIPNYRSQFGLWRCI